MNRRSLLKLFGALPFLGWLKPKAEPEPDCGPYSIGHFLEEQGHPYPFSDFTNPWPYTGPRKSPYMMVEPMSWTDDEIMAPPESPRPIGSNQRYHVRGDFARPRDSAFHSVPVDYGAPGWFVEGEARFVLQGEPLTMVELVVLQRQYGRVVGVWRSATGRVDTGNVELWAYGHDDAQVIARAWGNGGHYDLWGK